MLSFFPQDVFDEILDLIESVSEGFPTYSCFALWKILYIESSTSTGSDVIMTSNGIYAIILFSSTLLKTQMAFTDKIIIFWTFSDLHFKETKALNISNKEV